MKVFHGLEEYRNRYGEDYSHRCAVTLGKFDSIHIGHQKLIQSVINRARSEHLESVIFAIEGRGSILFSSAERSEYLESLGADILIECPFTQEFKNLSPAGFVHGVLADTLHAVYVAVGCDYVFGHNREGDVWTLKRLGESFGFETEIFEKEQYLGMDVSSSRIRRAVEEGKMELAEAMLGRPYCIAGEVIHGRHLGSTVNMPTANVNPAQHKILPPDGVYASVTKLEDQRMVAGVTNFGFRPTVNGRIRRAETLLFHFNENIYGTRISTSLIRFIRPETKFSDLGALREQVSTDSRKAMEILENYRLSTAEVHSNHEGWNHTAAENM